MKIQIVFVDNKPKISIYGLIGIVVHLSGRREYVVSKDSLTDSLSSWFDFFIKETDHGWMFGYKSNYEYTQDDAKIILKELVDKANKAITEKQSIDLSQEFYTLDKDLEPFTFGGLFAQMNERNAPVSLYGNINQDIAEMRRMLSNCMTIEQLEADEHLKNFVYQIPAKIIRIDDTFNLEH